MIRPLTSEDAEAYAALRRRMLETDPHAFLGTPEDDFAIDPANVRVRLAEGERSGDAVLLGAFDPELVGALGLVRERGPKQRHKGHAWGFWVAPERRGRGMGGALLEAILERARAMPDIEQLTLGVSVRSPEARRLYERVGFRVYGTEPRALRIGDAYLDEHLMALELPGRP